MIAWIRKHWKWGLPLLLIPLAFIVKGIGWLAGLFRRTPSGGSGPAVIHDSAAERERIREHREAEEDRIVTEADRERKDIDDWIDEGLNR